MKSSGSSEQLDADGDTGSEVSSEVSFSYEFAQTEVLMKALGSNGEGGAARRPSSPPFPADTADGNLPPLCPRPDAGRPPVPGEAA